MQPLTKINAFNVNLPGFLKEDMLAIFPLEMKQLINSYLSLPDSCALSLVSKDWAKITGNDDLWTKLCKKTDFLFSKYPFEPLPAFTTYREKFTYLLAKSEDSFAHWQFKYTLNKPGEFEDGISDLLAKTQGTINSPHISQEEIERIILKCYRLWSFNFELTGVETNVDFPEENLYVNHHSKMIQKLEYSGKYCINIEHKINFYKIFSELSESNIPQLENSKDILRKYCAYFQQVKDAKMAPRATLALGLCFYYLSFCKSDKFLGIEACKLFEEVKKSPSASKRDRHLALFFELSLFFQERCYHFTDKEAFENLEFLARSPKITYLLRHWVYIRQAIMRYERKTDKIDDQQALEYLEKNSPNWGPTISDTFILLYSALIKLQGLKVKYAVDSYLHGYESFDLDIENTQITGKLHALLQFAYAWGIFQGFDPSNNFEKAKELLETMISEGHLTGRAEEKIATELLAFYQTEIASSSEEENDSSSEDASLESEELDLAEIIGGYSSLFTDFDLQNLKRSAPSPVDDEPAAKRRRLNEEATLEPLESKKESDDVKSDDDVNWERLFICDLFKGHV